MFKLLRSLTETKPTYVLPFWRKIAYSLAAPADIWAIWIPLGIASPILTIQFGIKPWIVSMLFMGFRLWDAITDPLMGWISDNTNTRWGRRRPYIFVGAILLGIFFPLLWMFPRDGTQAQIIAYLIPMGLCLYTSLTIWAMPYHSMFMELTPDYHERTNINSYRSLFQTTFGMLGGWVWAITQLEPFHLNGVADTLHGMRWFALGCGIVMILIGVLPALFVKERFSETKLVKDHKRNSLWRDLKLTLSNRDFLIMVVMTVLFAGGTSLTQSFNVFIGTYYVLDGDETASAIWTGYGSTTYYVSVYLAIVFFSTFSKGQGKIKALKVALLVQLIGGASNYFIFIPGMPALMLVNSFLMGFGAQGTWLLVGSMIADIGDEDELNTGDRREGSFSSIFSNVVKLSFTLGFGVSGVLLELTGFDVAASTNQMEVFMKMKLYMAIIPVVALIFGLWVLTKYSITEDKAARIREELEARRGKI